MLSGIINKLGWRRCKASMKVSIAHAREPGRSYSSTYRFARGLTSRIFGGAFVLGSECGNVELVLYLWEQLLRGDEILFLIRFIGANIKFRQCCCSVKFSGKMPTAITAAHKGFTTFIMLKLLLFIH